MELSESLARELLAAQRVARLATARADGRPRIVPFTFAVTGDRIVHAVDHKPKRTTELGRLRDVRENPRVSILADHYDDDDWERLWWVRADGLARVIEEGPGRDESVRLLCEKYRQYRERVPTGPVIDVTVTRWTGWGYSPPQTPRGV
jgi:PPOX class probable F420-dependent enzyme